MNILHSKSLLFLLLILLLASCCAKQRVTSISLETEELLTARTERIDEPLNRGVAIAIFDSNGATWEYSNGFRDRDSGLPFNNNTILPLGEISGQFVILEALLLARENKLDPEKTVGYYLPGLINNAYLSKLPVKSIINESTGWTANTSGIISAYRYPDDLLPLLERSYPSYPQDARFTESTAMIDLLGFILSKIKRSDFQDLMKKDLFHPLGMEETTFSDSVLSDNIAESEYSESIEKSLLTFSPGMSMKSSVGELAQIYSILLDKERMEKELGLGEQYQLKMFSTSIEDQLKKDGFESGAGWNCSAPDIKYLGKVAWRQGSVLSFRTYVLLLLDQKLGIVISTNKYNKIKQADLRDVAVDLLEIYCENEFHIFDSPAPTISGMEIPEDTRPADGIYASENLVVELSADKESLDLVCNNTEYEMAYIGNGQFKPLREGEVEELIITGRNAISIRLKSGAVHDLKKIVFEDANKIYIKEGFYKEILTEMGNETIYFSISRNQNIFLIQDNENRRNVLIPETESECNIWCDNSSVFWGKSLSIDSEGFPQIHYSPASGR
ncbi:MAG: beta-lactamase family protein [Spirochaetales bacterium]|nr:beta-lactamase family protein [Spirochaetales bacterium]